MARVLYVSEGYTTHDRRFLEKLSRSPHEIWFLPCAVDRVAYERRPLPAAIHQLPPLRSEPLPWGPLGWLAALRRFGALLQEIKPDLVHAGPVQTGGMLAALWRSKPLLVMSWGSDVLTTPLRGPWWRWMTSFTLRRADMVIGDCEAVRQRIRVLASTPADRIVCFPWGIDLAAFHPNGSEQPLRRQLGWEAARVMITTRSFEAIHAPLTFLEAFASAAGQRDDLRAIMVGEGSLRPDVEAFIRERGLSERVHLPGQLPHPAMSSLFGEADLYVSSTYSDGTSISLLEAMACGLPVIVTDGYGNQEWVTPSVHGWLYPAGDAGALAGVMATALACSDDWPLIRQTNIALAQSRGDWEQNFNQLLSVYERLLRAPF